MKDWFTYQYGYVNIDDVAVYLNNTGNRSDIPSLKEKTKKNGKADKKKVFTVAYVFAYIVIFAGVIYKVNLLKYIGIGVIALFVSLYRYMIKDVGLAIKIPKNKIEELRVEEHSVVIRFVNGLGNMDELTL